jgi:hypothetical protein
VTSWFTTRDEDLATWIEDSDKDLSAELARVEASAREANRACLVGFFHQDLKDELLHRFRWGESAIQRTLRGQASLIGPRRWWWAGL